jgi:hypothetical protein
MLHPVPSADGADDGGCEGEDGEEADDLEDAAATAAKAQKQKGRGKQPGGSADEAATLTTPEQLRAKKGDTTLAVDPLFHTMSALFDEGGAKGRWWPAGLWGQGMWQVNARIDELYPRKL